MRFSNWKADSFSFAAPHSSGKFLLQPRREKTKTGVKVMSLDESCTWVAVIEEFHLLSHCGVDLGTCQVNVLINLGLQGERWDRRINPGNNSLLLH